MKNRVKEFRTQRGLTQDELSLLANVSRPIISNLENNKKENLSYLMMKSIANALKRKVDEVFFLN